MTARVRVERLPVDLATPCIERRDAVAQDVPIGFVAPQRRDPDEIRISRKWAPMPSSTGWGPISIRVRQPISAIACIPW